MRRLVLAAGAMVLVMGAAACGKPPGDPSFVAAPPTTSAPVVAETPTPGPSPQTTTSPSPKPTVTKPVCKTGKHHAEVELILSEMGTYGKIKVDGQQSDSDCATIKKFQKRFGLTSDGDAGKDTYSAAKRLHESDPAQCGAGAELTACVDLTHQTTWLMRDGKVIHGPTVTRTGYDHPDGLGSPTPSGTYKIKERLYKNWTESFEVYLYYWQRIMGNNGFHQTTTYIHDMSLGSHGCVNLLKEDAIAYWDTMKMGSTVKLFGKRPGT